MGPAVSAAQRDIDTEYLSIAADQGAEVVVAGSDTPKNGHFVRPAVITGVTSDMRIAQEEVFGPVIGILEAADMTEALRLSNDIAYGLSATIVTNDVRHAIRFAEQAEAGMLKVNQPTAGVSIQAPFGGFKQSGSGMFREMGKGAVEFFSQEKAVYIDGN